MHRRARSHIVLALFEIGFFAELEACFRCALIQVYIVHPQLFLVSAYIHRVEQNAIQSGLLQAKGAVILAKGFSVDAVIDSGHSGAIIPGCKRKVLLGIYKQLARIITIHGARTAPPGSIGMVPQRFGLIAVFGSVLRTRIGLRRKVHAGNKANQQYTESGRQCRTSGAEINGAVRPEHGANLFARARTASRKGGPEVEH